jgi:hypothetical protein
MISPDKPIQRLSPLKTPQVRTSKADAGEVSPSESFERGPLSQEADSLKAERSGPKKWEAGPQLGRMGLVAAASLAGMAGMMAVPAQAQVQVVAGPQVGTQQVVRVNNVREVVEQFRADQQVYVVGNPQYKGASFTPQDLARFQEVMRNNPHSYVVLVEQSSNVKNDDYTLSRGIGNHPAFTSLRHSSGEKDGSILMIYFKVTDQSFIQKTGKDRAIYMRTEQLLDDAGVGENNFIERETFQPRELFQTYVNAIQSGKDVAGAAEAVFQRQAQGVQRYLTQTVAGSAQQVEAGQNMLRQLEPQIRQFQSQHGERGQLGRPDVAAWRSQLQQADGLLRARDYAGATRVAQQVQASMSSYQSALNAYTQAPARAQQIQLQITQAEQALEKLAANGQAQMAQAQLAQAKADLGRYQTSYSANNQDFATHLDSAARASQSALNSTRAAEAREQTMQNIKVGGSAALGAVLLLTGIGLNARARKGRKEAEGELSEAEGKVQEQARQLEAVLGQASYAEVSAYQGQTQKLANDLIAGTAQALALSGGGQKFLAEARDLIKGKTFGARLGNMFFRGSFDESMKLLKKGQLSFDLKDSQRLELSPAGQSWRESLLANVPAEALEKSLLEVLESVEKQIGGNQKLVTTIHDKRDQVGGYLGQVQVQGEEVMELSRQLQEQGKEDQLFVAASVSERLLPTVLGAPGQPGLVQRGQELMQSDPVRAWAEFADQGDRLGDDARLIVAAGQQARTDLLPGLAQADAALAPHQVNTEWAHLRKQELSLKLDQLGEKAIKEPVSSEVSSLNADVQALLSRSQTVVRQDEQRREVAPKQMEAAESDVDTARQGLSQALKAAGVFKEGTPDQVLREPDRDPSVLTRKSHQDLALTKTSLDGGDIEKAGTHLENIRVQSEGAHSLVKQSREALKNYVPTAEERKTRRETILDSIPSKYQGSLGRIQATYAVAAQKLVAAEVAHAGTSKVETVAHYLDESKVQLETARSLNDQAQRNYERAYLLTSRDQLVDSDGQLKTAQANLDAITTSETRLAQHQKEAESELTALRGRMGQSEKNSQAEHVRAAAKRYLEDVRKEIVEAEKAVSAKPADPYAAKQALAKVENLRGQAESSMAADLRAFQAGNAAIAEAKSDISSAESEISRVDSLSWSTYVSDFGSVSHSVSSSDLHHARALVDSADSIRREAQGKMSTQDYEGAAETAGRSSSKAGEAKSEAKRVASREESHYDSLVTAAEIEAARRRREREQQNNSSSGGGGWDSGGSSGGGGGGGDSGSTGGGW